MRVLSKPTDFHLRTVYQKEGHAINKVLILTCSTGEGHNSAAHALETALQDQNIACQLADPVSFQSERMKHAVSSLYNNIIKKTPSLFGVIYKLGDYYCATNLPSPVYWANARYADALRQYILGNEFDTVVCTHLYGMEVMTAIRQDPSFTVPCYGVLTDYTCIPFMEETKLDGYFAPHESVKKELISKGIPENRIISTGIPVNKCFEEHVEKAEARKKLNIPQNKKVFLVMTGGIGCENMLGLCDALSEGLKKDGLVYVLTGKNDILKNKLDRKFQSNPQIRTVSFTKQVALYMAASDVLLSKSGGLSSTEAAVANIPLVHVHAIPGCETCNARFFSETGMSLYAKNEKEAVEFANRLAYDPECADRMQKSQQENIPAHAAITIVKEMHKRCIPQIFLRGYSTS